MLMRWLINKTTTPALNFIIWFKKSDSNLEKRLLFFYFGAYLLCAEVDLNERIHAGKKKEDKDRIKF